MKNANYLVTVTFPNGSNDYGLVYATTAEHAYSIAERLTPEGFKIKKVELMSREEASDFDPYTDINF